MLMLMLLILSTNCMKATKSAIDANSISGFGISYLLSLSVDSSNSTTITTSYPYIDGGSATGLGSGNDLTPFLVSNGTNLFNAYVEQTNGQVQVKQWNGTGYNLSDWTLIQSGIGISTKSPKMVSYNGILYLAWTETNAVKLSSWNGSIWTEINNGNFTSTIPIQVSVRPDSVSQTVYNNQLYLVFVQSDTSTFWNTSVYSCNLVDSSWTSMGIVGDNSVQSTDLVMYNNTLYLVNQSSTLISLYSFIDSNWIKVSDLNLDQTRSVGISKMSVWNNKLYISWNEYDGINYKNRIKEYDGINFTFIDSGGFSFANTTSPTVSDLITYNNLLYLVWEEHDGQNYQIRAKYWNGYLWTDIGSSTKNYSLNYDTSQSGRTPKFAVHQSRLYITWFENNKIRVYSI